MKNWNIPGLALGIVYKDRLIYAKGYGYRDLENNLPVQSTTIFAIGSNTKLFTATGACMFAEEGKLHLDKPVRTYMPSLNFNNDELNAKVTIRDMLFHRTGNASCFSNEDMMKSGNFSYAYFEPDSTRKLQRIN